MIYGNKSLIVAEPVYVMGPSRYESILISPSTLIIYPILERLLLYSTLKGIEKGILVYIKKTHNLSKR